MDADDRPTRHRLRVVSTLLNRTFVEADCQTLGFDAGTLACAFDCSAIDSSGCFDAVCPNVVLGSAFPVTEFGSTVGAPDLMQGGCGDFMAPDVMYEWTAPADGTYTFDTIGSSYDTVLYAADACFGMPLVCDDDSVGAQSVVALDLVADQTVIVVVSGFSSGSGDFTLNIN